MSFVTAAFPAEPPTDGPDVAHRVLEWVGHSDPTTVVEKLAPFHEWLRAEAIAGGAIGPEEGDRLWRRHIADSLTFLAALEDAEDIVDIGSGVGLPGIPLAVAMPDVEFTLLDRSERRCWLARRAVRVLVLENVEVVQGEATQLRLPQRTAVSRASLPPEELITVTRRLLPDGRRLVVAGSHGASAPANTEHGLVRVPEHVLGVVAWLTKISLSDPLLG